jgi:Bacterial Ig domain/Abnormal spindle-like microcephaly-assoc'd, ASPM-SPD-2-Hydin
MSQYSRVLPRHYVVLLVVLVGFAATVSAQVMQGPTTIRQNVHHDVSLPLSEMIKNAPPVTDLAHHEVEPMKRVPLPPGLSTLTEDPVLQSMDLITTPSPTVGLSFEGLGQGQYGFGVQYIPPDTNGTVGATQYIQWVNASFAIFNKTTGALIAGPTLGNTLWQGFGGGCQTNNNGDPVVTYDKLANRWVMSQFSVSTTPYLQCIAVSKTSDATGAWYRYSFSYGNSDFDDYPKMGVWPDAYYETFDMFLNGQTYIGPDACAYDRNKMLAGLAATQQCFQQSASLGPLLPADVDGTTPPPTGSPNYLLTFGTNTLDLYKFHVDWTNPTNSTFTGPAVINVAAFNPLCGGGQCVAEPGGDTLDSLGDRLMHRLAYRNFGTHESLVVDHSVTAGSSGGVRWYEIQNPSGTPVLAQQSTYAPDSSYRWMGSVAMDKAGNLAVGYSKSSSSIFPSVAFAGRLATDPVNTLQAETLVISGAGSQNFNSNNRWGDYSAMQVDPVDDCTFWYTQEYIKITGSFNWNTRIANFKFANCGSQVTINPTSLTFASQLVGTSSTSQPVTLTNSGTNALTGISIGASGDFSQTNNCGTTLSGNSSCTINVTFTPTIVGTRTGTLTVTDSAGTQTTTLSGTGAAAVSLSPGTIAFGNQAFGVTSSPQAATLANGQTSALTGISVSITGTKAADFAQTNNCGTAIAANSSCTINVTFTPSIYGAESATLSVTDSAGTQTSSLTGTGKDVTPPTTQITAPANHATVSGTVTVTATASDNVGVTSLQIYIDGSLKSSGTSSPLNYSWSTTTATNGTHTIYSKASDAAGNVGTSSTVTVTVNNSSSQLIQNGGFESGNLTSWNATGAYLPFVTSVRAHAGKYSAQLGASVAPEPISDSALYQTITIPTTATTASLDYYYYARSSDVITNDWLEAQIQDTSGNKLAQVMKTNANNLWSWTHVTFDLTAYKGQTIRIYFNAHQNGNGKLTYMDVDDVTVTVK